jgi:hypothetical protein
MIAMTVVAPGAMAEPADSTFTGTCRLSGTVHYPDNPLQGEPQTVRMLVRGHGDCTGTLASDGKSAEAVAAAPTALRVESSGTSSCAASEQTGAGMLEIHGQSISFDFSELREGAVAHPVLTGRAGGSAAALATTTADPAKLIEKCSDRGIREAPIEASLSTMPSISG